MKEILLVYDCGSDIFSGNRWASSKVSRAVGGECVDVDHLNLVI